MTDAAYGWESAAALHMMPIGPPSQVGGRTIVAMFSARRGTEAVSQIADLPGSAPLDEDLTEACPPLFNCWCVMPFSAGKDRRQSAWRTAAYSRRA